MFMTFNSQDDDRRRTATGPRARRNQVIRACNWCRLNRIKCDDNQPCRNCEVRGGECTSNGRGELRSLPQATREIERLKTQIKDLETQLQENRESEQRYDSSLSKFGTDSADLLEPNVEKQDPVRIWEGAWTNSLASTKRLYGPSSPFYYLQSLSSLHGGELNRQDKENQWEESGSASHILAHLTPEATDSQDLATIPMDSACSAGNLSYSQENYFLGLFWESYFCNIPILDESEFMEHHKTLWKSVPYDQPRKPSPLVDIVLALCMQYGMTFIPRTNSDSEVRTKVDQHDSSVAGRGFFRRCQSLLAYEMETPSINTLQCHILSALYLRNASFTTREHITIAVATRLAYLLGIHQTPHAHLSRKQQELRKRLFWCIFTAENKIGMNVRHPTLISATNQSCGLPSTNPEIASKAWSTSVTAMDSVTFLQYQLECAKLITTVRSVDTAFADKFSLMAAEFDDHNLYSNRQSFEELARFLHPHLQSLRDWVQQCPDGIKTPRRGGGRSFSTDRSALEIDQLAPLWLQRQCILLELLYHDQAMCLYGPFLRFSKEAKTSTALTDRMALNCLQHAIATANIVYQTLMETDILNGWHEACKYTLNAATSILAFIFGYPVNPSTQSAWRALSTVIEIFNLFGNNFAIAARAAIVTRDLAAKAKTFMERFRLTGALSPKSTSNMPTPTLSHGKPSSVSSDIGNVTPTYTQPSASVMSNATLPASLTELNAQPIANSDFAEACMGMDMDLSVGHPSLTNFESLLADSFEFQLTADPFCEFNTTYDEAYRTGAYVWPD